MLFYRRYVHTGDLKKKVCSVRKYVLRIAYGECYFVCAEMGETMKVFVKCLVLTAVPLMCLTDGAYGMLKANARELSDDCGSGIQEAENCFSAETDIPRFPSVFSETCAEPVNMPEVYINGGLKRYLGEPSERWRNMSLSYQEHYRENFWKNTALNFKTDEGRCLGCILGRVADDGNNIPMSVIADLPMPSEVKSRLSPDWNILLVSQAIEISVAGFPALRHQPKKIVMDPLNLLSEALMNQAYCSNNCISRWNVRRLFDNGSLVKTKDILIFPTKCYRFHITK